MSMTIADKLRRIESDEINRLDDAERHTLNMAAYVLDTAYLLTEDYRVAEMDAELKFPERTANEQAKTEAG